MVHIFQHVTFHGTGDRDVINQATSDMSGLSKQRSGFKKPYLRWITYSHSPTPPAWGQTGTPNLIDLQLAFSQQRVNLCYLAAISSTLRTSLTPASLQESTWTTSIASACKSCLKIMRLCACSPVATPIPCGLSAFRIAAWPRMSSGAVGSSMNLDKKKSSTYIRHSTYFPISLPWFYGL